MRTALLLAVLLLLTGCRDGADSYVASMAHQHHGDLPVASLVVGGVTDDGLRTARVVYSRHGGAEAVGFLAQPDTVGAPGGAFPARQPAVLLIHEWWGLNENIQDMARRLAHQGYTVLAVDLYGGEIAEEPAAAQRLLGRAMERQPALEQNLRDALRYLRDEEAAGRVGVMGWCFGGMWSLRTALFAAGDVDAAVVYYGNPVLERERLAALRAPLLAIFGAEDSSIPLADVRRFEATLDELGKEATVEVYDGAGHAFANPSGQRFVAEAAEDAWQKTSAFLARHLRGE